MNTRLVILSVFCAAIPACGDNLTLPPDREDYQPEEMEPLACLPNLDGRIDADELPVNFDVSVSYLISPAGEEREVDLAGVVNDKAGRLGGSGHHINQVRDKGVTGQSGPLLT